jgi:hypothetical protein
MPTKPLHLLLLLFLSIITTTTTTAVVTFTTDNTDGKILKSSSPVIVKGFAVTCLQYLLRGIGTTCLTSYNWNDKSQIIANLDTSQVDAIFNHLLPAPDNTQPAIRVSLTAAYWLDQSTSAWSTNRNTYPNLSQQYVTLIDNLITYATSQDVVVILDLHWNYDGDSNSEQQPQAIKSNSVSFWNSVATKYHANPYVWYELYNEPYVGDYSIWRNGNAQYEGMKPMYDAITSHSIKGLILIAGSKNYAYDADSLVQFETSGTFHNIAWVVHPYMGPYQAGDAGKNINGFLALVNTLKAGSSRPIIATEFGQYCCATNGACYQYDGTYQSKSMGFVEALMNVFTSQGISWTIWGWRPGSGGDCNQPDANTGSELFTPSSNHQGANVKALFASFYGTSSTGGSTTAPTTLTSKPTTKTPTSKTPTATTTDGPTKPMKTSTPSHRPTHFPSRKPKSTKKPTLFPTKKITHEPTTKTGGCVVAYQQCGGITYTGLTHCCAGSTCIMSDDYYSQCRPV